MISSYDRGWCRGEDEERKEASLEAGSWGEGGSARRREQQKSKRANKKKERAKGFMHQKREDSHQANIDVVLLDLQVGPKHLRVGPFDVLQKIQGEEIAILLQEARWVISFWESCCGW